MVVTGYSKRSNDIRHLSKMFDKYEILRISNHLKFKTSRIVILSNPMR